MNYIKWAESYEDEIKRLEKAIENKKKELDSDNIPLWKRTEIQGYIKTCRSLIRDAKFTANLLRNRGEKYNE